MAQEYLPAPSNIRLADLMKEHNISQPELAKEIGCSKSTISRFISGAKGTLTHEQVLKIARLFNVFMPYTRQKFIELDNYRKEKGLNYHLMLDGGATREVIADLYHNCNVEGFVLGKQELFFQQDDYATCIDRIRTF